MFERAEALAAALVRDLDRGADRHSRCAAIQAVLVRELAVSLKLVGAVLRTMPRSWNAKGRRRKDGRRPVFNIQIDYYYRPI